MKLDFTAQIMDLSQAEEINSPQRLILEYIYKNNNTVDTETLVSENWYEILYSKESPKTKERDLKGLIVSGFIIDENNQIRMIDLFPKRRLSKG